ncbi:2868_t:CDS:1, partial [Entrophospora sp. SA101]
KEEAIDRILFIFSFDGAIHVVSSMYATFVIVTDSVLVVYGLTVKLDGKVVLMVYPNFDLD